VVAALHDRKGLHLGIRPQRKAQRRTTRKLVLEVAKKAGVTLPDNVGRHTFISMHVERYENVAKAAKEANNSPEIVDENYRHLVSPSDVVKFWGSSRRVTRSPPNNPLEVWGSSRYRSTLWD
jgi:hypothetical protein